MVYCLWQDSNHHKDDKKVAGLIHPEEMQTKGFLFSGIEPMFLGYDQQNVMASVPLLVLAPEVEIYGLFSGYAFFSSSSNA